MIYPIHRCVKVANLRKHGYDSFKEWLDTPKNLYIGRSGRILTRLFSIILGLNGKIRIKLGKKMVNIHWKKVWYYMNSM
jgi:hypothetical protein